MSGDKNEMNVQNRPLSSIIADRTDRFSISSREAYLEWTSWNAFSRRCFKSPWPMEVVDIHRRSLLVQCKCFYVSDSFVVFCLL